VKVKADFVGLGGNDGEDILPWMSSVLGCIYIVKHHFIKKTLYQMFISSLSGLDWYSLSIDHRDQETTALSRVFGWGSTLYVRVNFLNTFSGVDENERKLIN